MYIFMHVCTYAYTYIYIYVFFFMSKCSHFCVHKHTHTYIGYLPSIISYCITCQLAVQVVQIFSTTITEFLPLEQNHIGDVVQFLFLFYFLYFVFLFLLVLLLQFSQTPFLQIVVQKMTASMYLCIFLCVCIFICEYVTIRLCI